MNTKRILCIYFLLWKIIVILTLEIDFIFYYDWLFFVFLFFIFGYLSLFFEFIFCFLINDIYLMLFFEVWSLRFWGTILVFFVWFFNFWVKGFKYIYMSFRKKFSFADIVIRGNLLFRNYWYFLLILWIFLFNNNKYFYICRGYLVKVLEILKDSLIIYWFFVLLVDFIRREFLEFFMGLI